MSGWCPSSSSACCCGMAVACAAAVLPQCSGATRALSIPVQYR
nr:MAG TPA: hypothetical protein [Caudoviricetes sp.]